MACYYHWAFLCCFLENLFPSILHKQLKNVLQNTTSNVSLFILFDPDATQSFVKDWRSCFLILLRVLNLLENYISRYTRRCTVERRIFIFSSVDLHVLTHVCSIWSNFYIKVRWFIIQVKFMRSDLYLHFIKFIIFFL